MTVSAALALAVGMPATGANAADPTFVSDPAAYVNPFIGTANAGNTYPGAVAPFGMLAWSPDQMNLSGGTMRSTSPGGYQYNTTSTRGFSLTHVSGAGCAGLSGDVPIMPVLGDVTTSPTAEDASNSKKYVTSFSHGDETTAPGAYKVTLGNGIVTDLAATTRAGSGSFTYPAGQTASLLVRSSDSIMGSSAADVTIDPATSTVSGSVTSGNFCGSFVGDGTLSRSYYTVHYTITFDKPFSAYGTYKNSTVTASATTASGGAGGIGGSSSNAYPQAGQGSGAYLSFGSAGGTVNARVGISYVSLANAQQNLATEIPAGTTLSTVKTQTRAAWNAELNRIKISDSATANERTVFYSALYHSLLHPNVFSDVNREYWGFDQQKHTVPAGQDAQYATFSGWDVYRSQIQLVTLLDPKRGSDIAHSLLNQANQNNGVWDRWTHASGTTHVMVGDPSAIAVASIVSFGGTDFPIEESYSSLAQAARVPTADDLTRVGWNIGVVGQRPSLDQYLAKGYYPEGCNAWGCPNETLEMASADYGLATLAKYLGKSAEYTEFATRSQNWQNQFNPNATDANGYKGYFQQRSANGTWKAGFDSSKGDGFVEGTASTYAWLVQHNPAGLFDAMGGKQTAVERLDQHFKDASGNYVLTGSWDTNTHVNMDNEPSVAVPWLYNYAGVPSKTQDAVRATIKKLWLDPTASAAPNGIPGNDDLGEMSSWLVFAAMGVFPENPSRAELTVTAPLFSNVLLTRANGKTLTINAPGANLGTAYIDSMKVDGTAQTKTYLAADAIAKNTTVDYVVSSTMNTTWGTAATDAPPSDRTGEKAGYAALDVTTTLVVGGATKPFDIAVNTGVGTPVIDYALDLPEGLTADHPTGTLTQSPSDGKQTASVRIRASSTTPVGAYTVPIHFTSSSGAIDDGKILVTVTNGNSLFATGLETGDPQLSVESERLDQNSWGEFCCGIGGLESKLHNGGDSTENAHTGTNAIVFSGHALASGASATNILFKNQPTFGTVLTAGTALSYWVYPQTSGAPLSLSTLASTSMVVDLLFTDGTRLSELGATASNGAGFDPISQSTVLVGNEWNQVSVTLPAAAVGKTIDKVLLAFKVGAVSDPTTSYARGWVDDISISSPTEPITVAPAAGLTVQAGQELAGTLATFSGGRGVDASSYTATVDWGDGSSPTAGVVEADGTGYVVGGTHTYATNGTFSATVTVEDTDGVQAEATVPVTVTAKPGGGDGGTTPVAARVTVKAPSTTYDKAAKVSVAVSATGVVPAGTVTVREGVKTLKTATLSGGRATLTLPRTLKVGKHALVVTYTPKAGTSIKAPTPAKVTLTVKKAKAKVKITSAKSLVKGKKATVKVTIKKLGAKTPTGKVTVTVGKKTFGTAKVKKSHGKWVAVVKTKKLTKTGKIKVTYKGNATFAKTSVTGKKVRR